MPDWPAQVSIIGREVNQNDSSPIGNASVFLSNANLNNNIIFDRYSTYHISFKNPINAAVVKKYKIV